MINILPSYLYWRIVLILLFLLPVTLWQTVVWTQKVAIAQIREEQSDTLKFYQFQIRSELKKFEFLPKVLAENQNIIQILEMPTDERQIASVNRYLEEINNITNTTDIYVINKTGLTIAASNWNKPVSFIGRNFDYRPYFQTAIRGGIGRYFALGTTSKERGYYFAAPVEKNGAIVGAVTVKASVDQFEAPGLRNTDKVIVTDKLGIIFIANDPVWRFKTIYPLDRGTLKQVKESLQYGDAVLSPLPVIAKHQVDGGGSIFKIRERPSQIDETVGHTSIVREYLVQSSPMPDIGWDIYVFSNTDSVQRAIVIALVFTVLAFIIVVLATVYLAQRHLAMQEKLVAKEALQKAHDELETEVRKRTAELRMSNECLQREIRERKQVEDELVQAGKLAALGQLSAGIVHEVNQPLAAIRSYADNALTFLERERYIQAKSNLITIGELTKRIAKITNHLKVFACKTPGKIQPVSFGGVIAYALSLLESPIKGAAVEVIQDMPEADTLVWGDAIRLEQVVVNLLKNALEAMQSQESPRKLYLQITLYAEHAVLIIRDTGPGIAEEHLSQLFDPFFTTKEIGKGLGLGLSISNKIIREFSGSLQAGNHEGGGAVFTVTLLRADIARENVA